MSQREATISGVFLDDWHYRRKMYTVRRRLGQEADEVMSDVRIESDSFGNLEVPSHKYWGAQTQRSLINFPEAEKRPIAIAAPFRRCQTGSRSDQHGSR